MTSKEVLARLERMGSQRVIDGMARYAIIARRPLGVMMGPLNALAKEIGIDHDLAVKLWASGIYEARLLAALIGDPERVTKREMNAWAATFENWADCDTICFKLWDRSPLAWGKAREWTRSPGEYVKRAGFVLMACLGAHDKTAPDAKFRPFLPLIEKGALDERNFVKKGVNWALRGIGRRSLAMNKAALAVARRLAASKNAAARWVGKDALRELASPKVQALMKRRAK